MCTAPTQAYDTTVGAYLLRSIFPDSSANAFFKIPSDWSGVGQVANSHD